MPLETQLNIVVLTVVLLTRLTHCENKNCFFTTENGQVIDMQSQNKEVNTPTSKLGSSYVYYYNPCDEFDLPKTGGEKYLVWQRSKELDNAWGLGKNPELKEDDDGYFLYMEAKERKTSIYLKCDPKKVGEAEFSGDETIPGSEKYKFFFTHASACPKRITAKGETIVNCLCCRNINNYVSAVLNNNKQNAARSQARLLASLNEKASLIDHL